VRRFYTIESWALAVLGAVHMAATFRLFNAFTAQALWFLGGGLLMVVVASLNLLNRPYGGIAPGLRIVCIAANISISAFAVTAGYLGRAGLAQWILVLGIVGPLTVLSCLRRVSERDAI
jgi:hypothetical protein